MAEAEHMPLDQFYDGSRIFQFLADFTGMPIDQVNFLLGQLAAVGLSFALRTKLAPLSYMSCDKQAYSDDQHKQRTTLRHWFAFISGVGITYFCFGKQVLLPLLMGVVSYGLLLKLPSTTVHWATLLMCMLMLSATHIYRQLMQQASFVIDVTGPLMMLVQRATTVAFSVHDGKTKTKEKMTKMQAKYCVMEVPEPLEYFSYLMSFQTLLAGPYLLYTDYIDYIHGNDEYARAVLLQSVEKARLNNGVEKNNVSHDEGNSSPPSPPVLNPAFVSGRKIALASVYAVIAVVVAPNYPVSIVTQPSFSSYSFLYKLYILSLTTSIARAMYYTAWLLAEAVCNMGGLGYKGANKNGKPDWDGASNVDILGVEFSTSMRGILDAWNCKTAIWLRYTAYERLPVKYQVPGTYLLSSMWHGFYPGYYLTFTLASILTIASRVARRSIRPLVVQAQGGETGPIMLAYHVFTFFVSRLILAYCVFTFVLLRFWPSVTVYWETYFYLHVLGLLIIAFLPKIVPPKRSDRDAKKVA